MGYAITWDLDVLFPNGSASAAFVKMVQNVTRDASQFYQDVQSPEAAFDADLMNRLQQIGACLKEAIAFTECLEAQNMKDKQASALSASLRGVQATYEAALTYVEQMLAAIPEERWEAMLTKPPFDQVAFVLREKRQLALQKLSPQEEALIADLSVDGYHAWWDTYNAIVGRLVFPYTRDGATELLSAGQAQNKLDDPDRSIRTHMQAVWEEVWGEHADLFANAFNHLAGFRLQVYSRRGWEHPLQEPLQMSRMQATTLETIWDTIRSNKPRFVQYLQRKAQRIGVSKLSWHDVEAPIGESARTYTYDEAAAFITRHLEAFSPKFAAFARKAFEDRWIEAEDRPGKRPGGFCTSFPLSKQSRIFMTFSGSASGVSTLAHELGHAFHQYVMDDLPELLQQYAMNVAETASTLAEMIVSDAALQAAESKEEEIVLLDDRIQRSIAFYMNIHARFLFETRFYEERKQGLVSVERLNELMVEAQKEAYMDSLADYHPHFWASKLHFYATDVPFYNFPYTFGYLFSTGLYKYACECGTSFEEQYIALLRDTGAMTVEALASRHLGVDLSRPEFWQGAIDWTVRDVERYLALTEEGADI